MVKKEKFSFSKLFSFFGRNKEKEKDQIEIVIE